jgi:hypothetical protein
LQESSMTSFVSSSEDDNDPLAPLAHLREAASRELGETFQTRKESLIALRDAIEALPAEKRASLQPLSSPKDHIRYLRGCKFEIKKTLKKMLKTVEFQREYPEYSQNITAKEFSALDQVMFQLNSKDPENRTLFAIRAKNLLERVRNDSSTLPPHLLARLNIYMFEIFTHDPHIQVYGVGLMNTFHGLGFWDGVTLTSITPMRERSAVFYYLQECMPLRIGNVYIIEEPFYIRWIFNMASVILSKKLRDRFHMCGENYNFIANNLQLPCCQEEGHVHSLNCLPTCLGGDWKDESLDWIAMRAKEEEKAEQD